MDCTAVSAPASSISWMKDGQVLSVGGAVSIVSSQNGPERRSRLKVSGLGPSDTGSYSCVATNPHGSDSSSVDIRVARTN